MVNRAVLAAALVLCGLFSTTCKSNGVSAAASPAELLDLAIGMNKDVAEHHLLTIAQLQRKEDGRQEVWRLNNDPRFGTLAVGFDRSDHVSYITAFVDKATVRERIAFASVGDVAAAKSEILPPHYRYIWTRQDQTITAYGDDPTYLTIYTLSRSPSAGDAALSAEDDD